MKSISEYIIEYSNKEFDGAVNLIKKCLDKKGYDEDEYKITKFGTSIRVYFIKGYQTHHEAVSKMGSYIDKELYKSHIKLHQKTMGTDNQGNYYQEFSSI